MKTLWLITLLFLLRVPLSAQVQESPMTSGNAFVRFCSVVDKDPAQLSAAQELGLMSCLSYIQGFSDGGTMQWTYVQSVTKQDAPRPYCQPDGIENNQGVRIVLKYIRDNPEEANMATPLLIVRAMMKAYPCPRK